MKAMTPAARPGRFKSWLRDWIGVPFNAREEAFFEDWGGRRAVAGVTVNERTAMQLDVVWACVRLIAETVASLPLNLYERTSAGKVVAVRHDLHFVLHDQPNPESTAAVFWEAVVSAMLLRGNAYCEKQLNGMGKIIGLVFLHPDRLSVLKVDGRKVYRYTEKDGRQREIPASRLWHVPGFSLDGVCGVSVIEYGCQVFGGALAAEQAAARTFSNGMLQTVYYKVAAFLKPSQRKEFKDNIMGSVERGETPLLEGGTDVGTIGIKPSDSQLLESRSHSVEQLCRWFRTDPSMVGHGGKDSNFGTGIEQKMIGFLIFTLAPWLRRLEQAISKDLLTPAERLRYFPKFVIEGLLRADSAARAAFYSVMVNNGILTRDEVRELEDRPPMGGNAAVLTVQSAMTTLDSVGALSDAEPIRNAMRSLLGLAEEPQKA